MQVTDEWLYEKMPIVDAAIIQRLEEGEEKDYVFTNHFIKAMNRLIQRETYMDAAKLVKRITQRAAVIVLVMLLGALAVPMSVKAYQAQLFHTIETHTDTSAVLEYSKADRHLIYNQKIITNEKMIFDMSFDRVERIGVNGMTVLVYWYQDDTFWA